MKTRVIFCGLLSLFAVAAVAQDVEYDDMYFNATDRAKLREGRQQVTLASNDRSWRRENNGNPTDSYSARNVNPEHAARSQSKAAKEDEQDYYVGNYQRSYYHHNQWNNSFNNWYSSPWYSNSYWGASPFRYGWSSPYYGFRPGWASSLSFYYGSAWNYGPGWNSYYYDPFFYDPYYSYHYGYASSYWNPYGGYYGWGPRVIVVDSDRHAGTYGKRNSRSSQLDRENSGSNRASGRLVDNGRSSSSGRTNTRNDYYDNSWRNRSSESRYTPSNSSSSFDRSRSNSSSSWESQRRSNATYTPSSSPSRSSSGSFSGGGSRSSGSSGGSGSRSSRGGN